jgi:multiple sugar transport system permease protein
VWPAVKNTLWLMVVFVPAQVLFAFGVAFMLNRARRGAGFFRTVFYLPALAHGGGDARLRLSAEPATGPVNIALCPRIEGLSGSTPGLVEASLVLLGLWGSGTS